VISFLGRSDSYRTSVSAGRAGAKVQSSSSTYPALRMSEDEENQ
jgi:hypothetical protein